MIAIKLVDTNYKFYAKIVNSRLKYIAHAIILKEQMGFRKGSSCTESIFTLRKIIEKRMQYNLKSHLALMAIEKGIDNVNRSV